jgi:hypothetical protein
MSNPDVAPKPGCSPTKAPNIKDVATFECDLADNDDAQIISNRQASVQSHRRMESQEKFTKFSRAKDTVSNERDYMLKTDRLLLKKGISKGVEMSPYCSPKGHANYLHINLAKLDDNQDVEMEDEETNRPKEVEMIKASTPKNAPAIHAKLEEFKVEARQPAFDQQKPKSSNITVERASSLGPNACQKILISKWIDYSSKYGLGYQLSNGTYGVLFNDSTKIIVSRDQYQFYYLKRDSNNKGNDMDIDIPVHDFHTYPEELKKKVILTQHFISYLMGEKFIVSQSKPANFEEGFMFTERTVFLKKYARENKAILLRLNNKMIQVVFLDRSELILGSDNGNVNFITSKGEVRQTIISNEAKSYSTLEKSDPSMYKRLNYAKEMLLNLINPNKLNKEKKKQPLIMSKAYSTESKENIKFMRKTSETTDRFIEFYATQNLNQNDRSPQPHNTQDKFGEVVKGVADEIRRKLANYNSHNSENTKPELRKSGSYKVTLKKASLDQK